MRDIQFRADGPSSVTDGVFDINFVTTDSFAGRLHYSEGDEAIIWVFGIGGGLGGPAHGVYNRLAELLRPDRVTSLELDYRRQGVLSTCIEDVRAGIAYLRSLGKVRIVLVGHSFGGTIVINAGVTSGDVIAVAALSSVSFETEAVTRISPRRLLLVHGDEDKVVPSDCSRDIYARASEPKRLLIYPACDHGLDECEAALDQDLTIWLRTTFARPGA